MVLEITKNTMTSLEMVDVINKFRTKDVKNRAKIKHNDLLKVIRDEFEQEINEGKISQVDYKDKKNESRPMYILNYSQCKQLLVRESKEVRKAVIKHIEDLEKKLIESQLPSIPKTYKQALEHLLEKEIEKEKLTLELKEQAPKVDSYHQLIDSSGNLRMEEVAKIIKVDGIGRDKLFGKLRELKILSKENLPKQQYIARKLFTVTTKTINNKTISQTLVTPQGLDFIKEKINELVGR